MSRSKNRRRRTKLRAVTGALLLLPLAGCAFGGSLPSRASLQRSSHGELDIAGEWIWGGWYRLEAEESALPTLREAWLLARFRALDEAIDLLSRAYRADPEEAVYLEARGALYRGLGFSRAAERDFERAAGLRPREPRIWHGLGRIRLHLKLPVAAADALGRALALGADDHELHLCLARAYRRMGKHTEAARHYDHAIERAQPPSVDLLVEAASLAAYQGVWSVDSELIPRARGWVASALEREPGHARAWLVHALLMETWGGDALEAYQEAVRLDPDNCEAWTNLAVLCHREGDQSGCRRAATRAMKLERDPLRRRALQTLLRPSISMRLTE